MKQIAKNPLYKNSFFIMLTSFTSAGFGFIFWMLAAKFYPKEDVGISTALISSMMLIVILSRLGFNFSVIRFFPEMDRSRVFSSSVIVTTTFAIFLSIIFILIAECISPKLNILKSAEVSLIYIIFVGIASVVSITGVTFVAIRRAEFQFLQSLIVGSRVALLIPLINLGVLGIFCSIGVSMAVAMIVSFSILYFLGIKLKFAIDRDFIERSFKFSLGNYSAGMFITAPNQIIPLIVLNVLGAEETAHYYIAFSIASLICMIPNATSMSLFVEGSYGEALKRNTIRALTFAFLLLIPSVIFIHLYGGRILAMIGRDYLSGLDLLKVMVLSSFFVTFCSMYLSIKRVQKDISGLLYLSALIFVLLISLSYVLLIAFRLVGVGYAWVLSYGIGTIFVIISARREGWI